MIKLETWVNGKVRVNETKTIAYSVYRIQDYPAYTHDLIPALGPKYDYGRCDKSYSIWFDE